MALRKARAAVAAHPEVEAAAESLLGRGNAVDAIVAGVFAACALSPGALLGPVQILVGGAGAGYLAIDGRVRQPGLGAPRPRGFVGGEDIPDAARVGVPWLPSALSVALATMGSATMTQVMGPATALAKGTPRAEVIARLAARGPRALEERPLGSELLAAAGRPSGGLVTADDLAGTQPEVQKATQTALGGKAGPKTIFTLPWTHIDDGLPAAPAHDLDIGTVRMVAAVDRNATFAVACWSEATEGLWIEEVGLRAPFAAEPVRRGQTRVKPGDVRPAAAPIAMVGTAAPELLLAAFGAGDAYEVLRQALGTLANEERVEAHGEARLVVVGHANATASVVRS